MRLYLITAVLAALAARSASPADEPAAETKRPIMRIESGLELGDVVRSGTGLDKAACDGIDRIQAERIRKRKGP
jgi:hypothetical protein